MKRFFTGFEKRALEGGDPNQSDPFVTWNDDVTAREVELNDKKKNQQTIEPREQGIDYSESQYWKTNP